VLFCVALSALGYGFALDHDQEKAMAIAQRYCSACHAVEPERFIVSTSPEVNWAFIHEHGPASGGTWAERMKELLDWPVEDPALLLDPNKPASRWMPVGQKRYAITQEKVDGRDARQFLLDVLKR
jgi:hypothetical protein